MTRICSSTFGLLLVASALQAGDSTPKNTVFKSDAGDAWVVSIKPAVRVAKAAPMTLPVPDPVDVTQAGPSSRRSRVFLPPRRSTRRTPVSELHMA